MTELQVLHVDDEPDMRLLVKLSLELDDSISTRSASSGTEALDATTYWKPDVILLDAVMPGMDGLATLQALQTNPKTAGIPVLFLTGRCTESDVDAFKASGSAGVIAKPFDPQALATAIRSFVQATAMPSPETASSPDFAGQTSQPAGAAAEHAAGTVPPGGAALFGTTTEALLLDGNGNAFALTITDNAGAQAGGASSQPAPTPALSFDSTATGLALPFTVQVTPLDAARVSDILGMDAAGLLSGDDHAAAAPDGAAIAGVAFPIGHAVGAGATDLIAPQQAGPDALHYGSPLPTTDWAALILPRAAMH